mmetsp:Transcript_12569/g.37780  ORF Transcript_12569/g.37780 Transcript_12569/m.37780 type:complete len:137 (+) Transcript_12569:558-968(+)
MDQPQRSTWPAHMHACACNANMISTLGLQLTLVRKRLQIPASWFTAQKPCDAAVMGPAVSNEDDNAYIQGLLKRTDQFRDQRRKERLLAYERRNFQDYFGFESGSLEVAKSRGINEETFNAIKKWMKENETGKRIQ